MTTTQLKKLKKRLPKQYGRLISSRLKSETITSEKVRRVFRGEITNPEIVIPVVDTAAQILFTTKKAKARISNLLKKV